MADTSLSTDDRLAIADEAAVRAIRQLAEDGELTPRERAAVERLAHRLVTRVQMLFDPAARPVHVEDDGTAPLSSD
jgi:hypothetical protein